MTRVLFVCIENSCRSQMAEGLARHLGSGILEAYSAGSKPSGVINPTVIELMKKIGIDLSNAKSKGFDSLPVQDFDFVITMGCQDACPIFPAKKKIDWNIPDPKGKDLKFFEETRDIIEKKVKDFIWQLKKN